MSMAEHTAPYSLDQIGTGTVRFPSGAPIPMRSDLAVDPYALTRVSKDVHVEGIMFWPQVTGKFPGVILLHEWWGLNEQIKETARRLACEGYAVLLPNLYGRLGGMVTASAELAKTLMERLPEKDVLKDINSCCEFLNTLDLLKRNEHAVVGFGMGGYLATQFACLRRRLSAAVSFYGRVPASAESLRELHCPLLYHHAGADELVSPEDVERLREAAKQYDKRIEIRTYEGARHAFANEARKDAHHPEAARAAWTTTAEFLAGCLKGA